jgi:predicted metal-binding membrane protein
LNTAVPDDVPLLPARDRWTLLGALAALGLLAWAYLWWSPMPMPATSGGLRTVHYVTLSFLMWFVMMVGMMTPSIAPTVLLFNRVARRSSPGATLSRTVPFVAGYLAVWFAFSIAATSLQVEAVGAGWIDAMGVAARPRITAILLFAVGLYQWLPAKRACLDHCHSPVQFLVTAYRPGARGAFGMGLRHGLYCLGCCWAFMLLLFVGGVMNLLWVALIAALVFLEKLVARGEWVRRSIGAAAMIGAVVMFAR